MILITRPEPSGKALCDALGQAGIQTLWLPTIAFKAMKPQLNSQTFDWLIFVSPEAVRQYCAIASPSHGKNSIAAIGKGTADVLKTAGYRVDAYPRENANAEALLALPVFQNLFGKKIAIIKGKGGRKILAQTLIKRGALITEIPLYTRDCPQIENLAAYTAVIQQKKLTAILITSGQGLLNLLKIFKGKLPHNTLQNIPLIVISSRLIKIAKRLGFKQIWLAENTSEDAIIALLHTKKERA